MFVALGAAFAVGSLRYELGTLLAMGPGYVPLVVGCVLAGLGVAVVVKGYFSPDTLPAPVPDARPTTVPGSDAQRPYAPGPGHEDAQTAVPTSVDLRSLDWRSIVLLTAAPVFFGATVTGLGLLPAAFGTGLLAAFARKETSFVRALLTAAGLAVASYVIFVVLLQVRLGLVGDWLGG